MDPSLAPKTVEYNSREIHWQDGGLATSIGAASTHGPGKGGNQTCETVRSRLVQHRSVEQGYEHRDLVVTPGLADVVGDERLEGGVAVPKVVAQSCAAAG